MPSSLDCCLNASLVPVSFLSAELPDGSLLFTFKTGISKETATHVRSTAEIASEEGIDAAERVQPRTLIQAADGKDSLGAGLIGIRPGHDLAVPLFVTAIQLLVLPAIVYAAGRWVFDLTPLALAVSVICAALPSGNNAFIFAQRHQLGVERSASAVLLSTALSVVTLSLLLGLLT